MLVRSFLIPFRFCTTTSLLNQGLVRLLFWCAAVLTCSTDCTCHSCIFVWHKRHDVVQYVVLKKCCSNMFHYFTYNLLVQICWFRFVGSDMLVVMISCAAFWDSIFFVQCNKVIEQALCVLSCFYASCISLICTTTTLFLTWVCFHCFFGVLPF